jgi:hypothetical protein
MLYINTRKSDSILCFWFISLAFLVPFWFTRKVHQIPAHHSTITFCTHSARLSFAPIIFRVYLPFWIVFPSILSSSSMGLSILAVVKRLLCRMECEKWKCRQRKYTRATRKIIKVTMKNVSHTHTKRNKGTGIDACKRDQRWARWFWLSTLIPFWNLFYYTIYLFTFIDGRKSTCQQAFSLSLPISPLICYTFVYTLRNSLEIG